MNIVLKNPKKQEYYVACVKRDGDVYIAMGKCVDVSGKLREFGTRFNFNTLEAAQKKCKELAKIKVKKRKYSDVPLVKVPEPIQEHLEVPPDMQLTPQEMVALIADARRERYVVFRDVDGMENYFDQGIEYIGYAHNEDSPDVECLEVYDRFGDLRHCLRSRMASINPTERCIEVGGLANA